MRNILIALLTKFYNQKRNSNTWIFFIQIEAQLHLFINCKGRRWSIHRSMPLEYLGRHLWN